MIIGIPVYEKVDLLDVAGPFEMFGWVPNGVFETLIISSDGGSVTTGNGVTFEAHRSFATAPALDVLWVPGGDPATLGTMMSDPDHPYFVYLRAAAPGAQFVCSVCEGALLLARAGLLDGYRAATHWAFVNCLKKFDRVEVDESNPRFLLDGNRLTGGGISSGLDEALKLIMLVAGEDAARQVQLTTQYFPDPPVSGTIPSPAPPCRIQW